MNNKFLQAMFAILPMLLSIGILAGYFIWIFSFYEESMLAGQNGQDIPPEYLFRHLKTYLIVVAIASILILASMVYYLIHISKNTLLDSSTRVIWIVMVVIFPSIGTLVYWLVEIVFKNKTIDSFQTEYDN